jgi:hypothetical protein
MPDKFLSQVQQRLVEQALQVLRECDFDGVVLMVSGRRRGKKAKPETFKEVFFEGNMLVNECMMTVFAEIGDPTEEEDEKEEADEDDDDGDDWKKKQVQA